MQIRIVLADDHNVLRSGLVALLNAEPDLRVVGEATCGEQALALAAELRKLGAEVEERSDGLRITPRPLHGAEIATYNDHRMAMCFAILGLKVPQIGWNQLDIIQPDCPLYAGIPSGSYVYFVHSYYPQPADRALTAGTCSYGITFTCAVARDNIFAVQFHPEKSQHSGLRLLSNFVQWRP